MPDLRERVLYPRAGWLSVALLGVMTLALAWSVQGAGWLPRLDFLVPVGLYAVACGALLGMLRSFNVLSLMLAAVVGGAVVVLTVGAEYHPALTELQRLEVLGAELTSWIRVVVSTGYPSELSPFALGLGMLMWTTAFMAAYAVYRRHRVLDAVLLLGAALIINMSATLTDLFGHLLLFVAAALLLWLRGSLATRQEGWLRRRVNENMEVPAAIMRSGIVFAGASVVLAWVLTSVAVAAPLTEAWRGLDGVWTDVRDRFDGVFGTLTNPQSRITGNSFGSSFVVSGSWVSNDDEALLVAAPRPVYLRTVTYDRYTGRGWERSDGEERAVAAGELIFESQTPERPSVAEAFEVETIAVEMLQTIGRNLFTTGSPLRIYAPIVVHESGGQPVLGGLTAPTALAPGEAYQASVAISRATEAQLEAAGTDYPEAVTALYLDTTGITERVAQLARDITAGAENPYQQAKALAAYLSRDESFRYETEAPVPPRGQDLVDSFLFDEERGRIGYCQHYASAMAVMARSLGLPARVAVGFAPGEANADGTYTVREANAHAWVEIYFPGYGWEIFEATKTIDPRFVRAPGDRNAAPPPSLSGDPLSRFEMEALLGEPISTLPSFDPVDGGFDVTRLDRGGDTGARAVEPEEARAGNALVMFAIAAMAGTAVWLRMRQVRRRWALLPAGERAWRQMTQAAGRAGVGPRPSETIYEYSGWLEAQLPRHREPIRAVADGKVWQAYSGRRLSVPAARRLEAAWDRLRRPLLLLALRRRLRSLFPRRR